MKHKKQNRSLIPVIISLASLVVIGFLFFQKSKITVNFDSSQASNNADNGEELKKVKDAIKEKGAKWEAGDTSVSKLSKEDKKKRLGLKSLEKSEEQSQLPSYSAKGGSTGGGATTTVPAAFDWRNNGGNFVTPVKDQGNCGSCWAFASVAALESVNMIKNKTPFVAGTNDLSEQVMLSCSGAGTCDSGNLENSSRFLSEIGTPTELCYAYSGTNGACTNACTNWMSQTTRFNNYLSVNRDVASLKSAIYKYGPVMAGFAVYEDFYYYTGGVYQYTYGQHVGNHAVILVGYDDASQSFVAKNSWGEGWGEGGYFRIGYSEVSSSYTTLGMVAYAFNTVADSNPQATITSPLNGATIKGTTSVDVTASSSNGISSVKFYVDGVWKSVDTTAPWSYYWPTGGEINGAHKLYAVAIDSAGHGGTSSVIDASVQNGADIEAPVVNITSPLDNGTVSKIMKVYAKATDDVGVYYMEAAFDGKAWCSAQAWDNGNLYCPITLYGVAKGAHTVTVTAKDFSGKSASSMIHINLR